MMDSDENQTVKINAILYLFDTKVSRCCLICLQSILLHSEKTSSVINPNVCRPLVRKMIECIINI